MVATLSAPPICDAGCPVGRGAHTTFMSHTSFLSSEPEEWKLGRGLALSKRKAFPTSLVVLLLDHVACEVGVPEGDALPDLDLGGESVKERRQLLVGQRRWAVPGAGGRD